jgi:NAD(P)-dependent dehydrogenase (short-subunit alcohol dehydrogenase family)
MSPQPRHALITGGSRGIGLAIAQALSKQNYRCTLISRSESTLKAALSTLEPSAAPHRYIAGSISAADFWSTPHFKENGLGKGEDGSKIDVLVNCAGITQSRLFATTPAEDVQHIVDTNLTALMLGTRFLLRHKYLSTTSRSRAEAGGKGFTPRIINVASLLGVSGGYGAVAYAASKAGVLGFTRALAGEYVGHGVRVNAIVPGYVESDMTKGRFSPALLCAGVLTDRHRPEHITAPRADSTEAVRHTGRDCTCSAVSCGKSVCA